MHSVLCPWVSSSSSKTAGIDPHKFEGQECHEINLTMPRKIINKKDKTSICVLVISTCIVRFCFSSSDLYTCIIYHLYSNHAVGVEHIISIVLMKFWHYIHDVIIGAVGGWKFAVWRIHWSMLHIII